LSSESEDTGSEENENSGKTESIEIKKEDEIKIVNKSFDDRNYSQNQSVNVLEISEGGISGEAHKETLAETCTSCSSAPFTLFFTFWSSAIPSSSELIDSYSGHNISTLVLSDLFELSVPDFCSSSELIES
jgi:hypothetical protein